MVNAIIALQILSLLAGLVLAWETYSKDTSQESVPANWRPKLRVGIAAIVIVFSIASTTMSFFKSRKDSAEAKTIEATHQAELKQAFQDGQNAISDVVTGGDSFIEASVWLPAGPKGKSPSQMLVIKKHGSNPLNMVIAELYLLDPFTGGAIESRRFNMGNFSVYEDSLALDIDQIRPQMKPFRIIGSKANFFMIFTAANGAKWSEMLWSQRDVPLQDGTKGWRRLIMVDKYEVNLKRPKILLKETRVPSDFNPSSLHEFQQRCLREGGGPECMRTVSKPN